MIRAAALCCVLMLGACAEVETAVDRTARQAARGVVTETLATRFPNLPKEQITPVTDCIIDNAKAIELREFARAAVAGVNDLTVDVVRNILTRPETVACVGNALLTKAQV